MLVVRSTAMEFDYGQCSKPAITEDVHNRLSLHEENWSDLCVIGCMSKKKEQIVREYVTFKSGNHNL